MICIFEDSMTDIFHKLRPRLPNSIFIDYKLERHEDGTHKPISEYEYYLKNYNNLYIFAGGNGHILKILDDSSTYFPDQDKIVFFDLSPKNYEIYKLYRKLSAYASLMPFHDTGRIFIVPMISSEYTLLQCMYNMGLTQKLPSLNSIDVIKFEEQFKKEGLISDDKKRPPDNVEDLLKIFNSIFFELPYFKHKTFEKRCKHSLRYATTNCLREDPHDFLKCPCTGELYTTCVDMFGKKKYSLLEKQVFYKNSMPCYPSVDKCITYNQFVDICNKYISICNYVLHLDSLGDNKMYEINKLNYLDYIPDSEEIPLASERIGLCEIFEINSMEFQKFHKNEMQALKGIMETHKISESSCEFDRTSLFA